MTELYIDGTSVVLPADFSTSVKRENPFFTKNGEYTYDITLQLSNSINADLYEHLNRLNSIAELKTKRHNGMDRFNSIHTNSFGKLRIEFFHWKRFACIIIGYGRR